MPKQAKSCRNGKPCLQAVLILHHGSQTKLKAWPGNFKKTMIIIIKF
jgi:hypothetical protein